MLVSACGGGHRTADKAGGVAPGPRVLRIGTPWSRSNPDFRTLEDFAKGVARRSGGRLRLRIVTSAGGAVADPASQVASLVRQGKLDMAFVDTRAWEALGVHSFLALQAPFLIRDDAALVRVATSRVADRMLAGLRQSGVTGLTLIPYLLSHPVAARRPLVSPADLRGAHLALVASQAADALALALGATPVHVSQSARRAAVTGGAVDGALASIFEAPPRSILTANVGVLPDVMSLVANSAALGSLSPRDRADLQAAAEELRAGFLPPRRLSEASIIESWCRGQAAHPPRIVLASRGEIAALTRATRPVYAQLERDPLTKALIAQIRTLDASTSAPPPLHIPSTGCGPAVPAAAPAAPRDASALNGTYRYVITKADARAKGTPSDNSPEGLAKYPLCFSVTLRDGRWLMVGCTRDAGTGTGTYALTGNRVTFVWPEAHSRLTFTFDRDRDRTLRLEGVPPMDAGDRFIWSTEPWRRIGPPVKPIP